MRFSLKYAALVAACMAAFPAYATNGYFLPGNGFRSQGMGGVGIAYGRDSLSIASNPANIVNTGMRADLGFGIFNPERHAAVGSDVGQAAVFGGAFHGSVESDSKYFIMPEMGMTMPLTDNLHVGFAVVGNGGMNTNYSDNFFSFFDNTPPRDHKLGVDMMQLIVPITVGYKVNEHHAIGVSLNLAETRFRAYGLDAFTQFAISSDDGHMTNQGFDYSYGAGLKVGWLGNFLNDKVTLGLAYTSRTYMTKFDKYRGLFAEQGDFDIPENYGIGIAFKPKKNIVIAADVFRINYHDVASVGNRGPGTPYTSLGIPAIQDHSKNLGLDNGMGFGWNNQTVYKLGVQYGINQRLQVRAGYNYGKSPIPNDQLTFNTLAPATVEKHYSVGFTYKANENLEVTGTYLYAASHSQHVLNNQNILGGVEIDMHQNLFAMSLGWVLDPGPHSQEEYGNGDWAGINFDGWYAGLGFGQSQYRDVSSYIDAEVASGATPVSSNNRTEGWKAYTGYQFNKYLGVEGGYANLNDMSNKSTKGANTYLTNVDTDAWTLAVVGTLPVTGKFSVTGRLGAAYMLSDVKTQLNTNTSVTKGDDGYEPYYGVGVSYALFDNLDLRADWERFDRKDLNIDLLTAGVAVKF
ncbi:MAG: outer membrane protein transport protein [Rhizobium sp.]|nr:outer membrane protein transport protein [Rhizobium sp.]